MTWDQTQATKTLMYNQNRARAQALIDTSAPGSLNSRLGYDILSNNTFTQASLLNPHSRVGLPEGNQLGRIFLSAAHRGVMPGADLMNFANQADAFSDWWNPSGVWNMWFSGSGSREWMGGVGSGSYFRGNSGYVFSGDANESWYGGSYAGNPAPIASRLHGPALPPGWKVGPDGRSVPGRVVPGGYSGIGGPAKGLMPYQPFGGGNPFADIIPGGIEGRLHDLAQALMGGSGGSRYGPSNWFTEGANQFGKYGPGNAGGWRNNQLGFPGGFYPARQIGGDVSPMTSYKVNERGEEIFMSGTRGQIISRQTAEQTLAKASGYGGNGAPPIVNVMNNVPGAVIDGHAERGPDGSIVVMLNEMKRSRARRIVPR